MVANALRLLHTKRYQALSLAKQAGLAETPPVSDDVVERWPGAQYQALRLASSSVGDFPKSVFPKIRGSDMQGTLINLKGDTGVAQSWV